MVSRLAKTVNLIYPLAAVTLFGVISFETFVHLFLHTELHPLDTNHLIVGSTTAILFLLLIVSLFTENRLLARKTKEIEVNRIVNVDTLFKLIADKSSDMVHLNDEKGTILYANQTTNILLGYKLDELLGTPAAQIIQADYHDILRNDMERVANGEEINPRQIKLICKDGSLLDVEVEGFYVGKGVKNKYIGAVIRDISLDKEKNGVVREKEEWLRTFDSMTDFISVHDTELKVVKANKALYDFLGKPKEEVIGKYCYELFHGQNKPWDNCPHIKAMEFNHSIAEEINDPNIGVPLLVTCSPFYNEKNEIGGTVHVARAMTEKNIAGQQKSIEIRQLNEIADKYKALSGIITMCAYCRNIRDNGDWLKFEEFIGRHTGGSFSHGICDDCFDGEYKKIKTDS